jgi:gluconate 2-dehydrogenase subunit 3-like protein
MIHPEREVSVPGTRFFTAHQAAVIEDATARIAPGPRDDPLEAGHPGAREAHVTAYIDTMLSALDAGAGDAIPRIFATGPRSAGPRSAGPRSAGPRSTGPRSTGPESKGSTRPAEGRTASFAPLDPVRQIAWRSRLTRWQDQYRQGIQALDQLAGGDFTSATPQRQDEILATQAQFTALLFEHTIEGLYASPAYGGNRDLAGWREIGFPGDVRPHGYTAAEVERSDGHDPVDSTGIVADVLDILRAL